MSNPKISVVVPSFNQASFIEKTLRSIIDQGYPNLELIVIDGGSSDGSVDIIRRYEDRITYWVSEPDGGQTNGIIKGFERATGEIAGWLNSDDLYEPDTLREVAQYFSQNPSARFVYGNCTWIAPNGDTLYYRREMGFHKWLWLYSYNYIPQPASFWKLDLYRQVSGLDPAYKLDMDGDLFARFSNVTQLDHVDRPWARFRYYPEQRNQKFRAQSDQEEYRIMCRELGRAVLPIERALFGVVARAVRFSYRKLLRWG